MTLYNFHKISRVDKKSQDVKFRTSHFKEFVEPYSKSSLKDQASRCMDCGVAFCHSSCPVDNNIPNWNSLSSQDDYASALNELLVTNPFPEFTGRVCPAPCENACVLGINHSPVSIQSIEHSLIEMGFDNKWIKPRIPSLRSGLSIAIIGSGPAGLSAAERLNQLGYRVVVYEKSDRVGGLLTYGIPDFKLEKSVVERRVNMMQQEGIIFKCGVEVGKDISISQLKRDYAATVFAIGAGKTRDLPIKGRQAKGIYFAENLLKYSTKRNLGDKNYSEIPIKGKKVVVIGGGDTGSDCIGTSVRFGASEIHQLEIRQQPLDCGKYPRAEERPQETPWPMWANMLRNSSSHEEGGQRYWSTKSLEFETNDTNELCAVVIENLETGRKERIACDLAFLAIGFEGVDISSLEGIRLSSKGNIQTIKHDAYMIDEEGLFCCGDARRGQSLVVWAIKEGEEAAKSVHRFLQH